MTAKRSPGAAVEVWHYALDVVMPEAVANAELDESEIERANRFRFARHRRRFVAAHLALRRILARYAGCAASDIAFGFDDAGKPHVAGPAAARGLHFNASDSENHGAVAVGSGGPLGLDIEAIRPLPDYPAIVAGHFSPGERAWLERRAAAGRLRDFFRLWTCKEAYLKGIGVGLALPLDRFSVDLDARDTPQLDGVGPDRWFLRELHPQPDLAGCLACACEPRAVHTRRFDLH